MFKNYKSWLAEQGHDTTNLFPTSNAGNSGTTKVKLPHVSDKSISSWLAKVRTEAAPLYGESIRPFASHTYRHSLAVRFLDSGATYEDVARILGDTVATIETHYLELDSHHRSEKHGDSSCSLKSKTTDGTAQPEWLDRFRKFGLQITTTSESALRGYGLQIGGGRTRIRTRVFGLEGQSDIQTTLYVLVGCGGSLFKKVTID